MGKARLALFVVFLAILSSSVLGAKETLTIDVDAPTIITTEGRKSVVITDFGSTLDEYMPVMPAKTVYFELPSDASGVKIKLSKTKKNTLNLANVQEMLPPMPANDDPSYKPKKRPDNLPSKYPAENFRFNGIKKFDGKKLASITIFPVQYYAEESKADYHTQYEFEISYSGIGKRKPKNSAATADILSDSIINEEEGAMIPASASLSDDIKYAIITTNALQSALVPLKEWKTQKGVKAEIYTTEYIYANFAGSDNAEKIRNFLISLEDSDDIDWILLAGDVADVPTRNAYCDDTYAGDGNYVPTDHYYADLEGSYSPYDWDFNNDGLYGNTDDQIDFLPEAYVGRLSTSNLAQMQTMVSNIVNYEKSPSSGAWQNKVILAGAKSDDSTDEAFLMELIRTNILGSMTKERVYYLMNYQRDYPLDFTNFQNRVSAGATLVNWAGHGSYTGAAVSQTGSYFVTTATSPSNGAMRPVVYADSCNTGGFDQATSLAEDIIRDWGIGFVGASRVSWYAVGWTGPNHPWNQAHDYRFFEQLIGQQKYKPGKALYDSKVDYMNDFASSYDPNSDIYSRKNFYDYNLLGDPELDVWTAQPSAMQISYTPTFIEGQPGTIIVNVTSSGPLAGAIVCLQNDEVHYTGITDAEGVVSFSDVVTTSSAMMVTATKHNYVPAQGNLTSESPINITLLSPLGEFFATPDFINFTFIVDAANPITNCSLLVDSSIKATMGNILRDVLQSFFWNAPIGGNHTWTVGCYDNNGYYHASSPASYSAVVMDGFDGNSTDLDSVDIENITNLVIEKTQYGAINFTESINLSGGVDVASIVTIRHNKIEIKSELAPSLDKPAVLTIKGISVQDPVILRNNVPCTDCAIIEKGADYVVFSVSHFSSYSVSETIVHEGESGQYSENNQLGNATAQGKNVTRVDLSGMYSTSRWQGFFGNVSAGLTLAMDNMKFYDFPETPVTAVYATKDPAFDWDNIAPAIAGDIDSAWGFAAGNDIAANTFTLAGDFDELNNVPYTLMDDGIFKSYIVNDGNSLVKDDFAFGANVSITGDTGFDGSAWEYEMLVPSDGIESFYFFLSI